MDHSHHFLASAHVDMKLKMTVSFALKSTSAHRLRATTVVPVWTICHSIPATVARATKGLAVQLMWTNAMYTHDHAKTVELVRTLQLMRTLISLHSSVNATLDTLVSPARTTMMNVLQNLANMGQAAATQEMPTRATVSLVGKVRTARSILTSARPRLPYVETVAPVATP
jgi:hypothetical protein